MVISEETKSKEIFQNIMNQIQILAISNENKQRDYEVK